MSQAGPEELSVTSTSVVGGVNPCTDGGRRQVLQTWREAMNVSPMSYGTLVCHLQAAGSAKTMVCMCA